jgi:hypothetical protein
VTISTQCSSYADLWAAHRDRAGPLTPADVYGLAHDREFVAPSRAHIKRLQRARPYTTPAPSPRPDVLSAARIAHNVAVSAAAPVRDAIARAKRLQPFT